MGRRRGDSSTRWVTVSRFLEEPRARSLGRELESHGIDARLEHESGDSSIDAQLWRVRVEERDVGEAFEVRSKWLPEKFRWAPPMFPRRTRPGAALLRRLFTKPLDAEAPLPEDAESLTDLLLTSLRAATSDRTAPEPRLLIGRALLSGAAAELDERARLRAARIALDEAVVLGAGAPAYFELAEACLQEGLLDEASAWNAVASRSAYDPARAAYLKCELCFSRGDSRSLRRAVAEYRDSLDAPDLNFVHATCLLYAAGEKLRAQRLLDSALRDGALDDEQWAQAAALKVAMSAARTDALRELSTLVNDRQLAEALVAEAEAELRTLRGRWREVIKSSKRKHEEA